MYGNQLSELTSSVRRVPPTNDTLETSLESLPPDTAWATLTRRKFRGKILSAPNPAAQFMVVARVPDMPHPPVAMANDPSHNSGFKSQNLITISASSTTLYLPPRTLKPRSTCSRPSPHTQHLDHHPRTQFYLRNARIDTPKKLLTIAQAQAAAKTDLILHFLLFLSHAVQMRLSLSNTFTAIFPSNSEFHSANLQNWPRCGAICRT